MIELRLATKDDVPEIMRRYDSERPEIAYLGTPLVREGFVSLLEKSIGKGNCLVLKVGKDIAAMLIGALVPCEMTHNHVYYAALFYVSKSFRRFTKSFVIEIEKMLKGTQANMLVMGVNGDGNFKKTARFYSMLGYKPLEMHMIKAVA